MEWDIRGDFVRLRYNPLQIFKASKTPAGLYARQKWLDESGTVQWQDDFHETLRSLINGQSDDGSWSPSPLESVRRLFDLHLTIRDKTEEIEKALDWLMGHTLNYKASNLTEPMEPLSPDAFRGLPFMPGQTRLSLFCMTLFLAAVFQKGNEPNVLAHYHLLSLWVSENAGTMDTGSDNSNALRALVVHPDYAEDPATAALVDYLGQIQDPSGCWPVPTPFFRTVNALAHLHLEQAHRQWDKALPNICSTQNSDGSWGNEDREWNTFLVVHALKNKGCL
jgi:hypothetical protein